MNDLRSVAAESDFELEVLAFYLLTSYLSPLHTVSSHILLLLDVVKYLLALEGCNLKINK